jgi:mRNA interferase MazF
MILSRAAFNDRSGAVVVVASTSAEPRAGFQLTMELTKTPLPKRTWVKIFKIRTISTYRLVGRLAACDASELIRVVEGMNELIGKS